MKYFDENNQIIKALQGLEFLRPKLEPVIDNTGGLGAAQYYNLSMERKQEAEKTKAEAEAKAKVLRMQDAQRRLPQLRATTAAEQKAARRRTEQHEIQLKLDENAANIGYTLGSVGRQNYNSLMGNYTSGANAFALFGAPLLTTAFYGGKDLSEGNYGWALASVTPFARVRGAMRGAISGYKTAAKEAAEAATKKAAEASTKAAAKESTAAIENEVLADIRYGGSARNKRPKVYGPETKVYTLDNKPFEIKGVTYEQNLPYAEINGKPHVVERGEVVPAKPAEASYYTDALGNRHYGEPHRVSGNTRYTLYVEGTKAVPERQTYTYKGQPVESEVKQGGKWFQHEGEYRPSTDIKLEIKEGHRIKPGEEIPEDATVLNRKTGKLEPLDNQVFRTPTGWGRNSYIYADGTPVEWWKNPGFYKKAGVWGGGTLALIGLPNAGTIVKGAAEGSTTGNGVVPGIIKALQEKFKSEADSIQSENTNDSIQAVLAALKRALEVEDSTKQAQFQSKQDLYNRNVKR